MEPLAHAVHLFVDDILSSGGAMILSVIMFPTKEVSDQCFKSGGTHQSVWKLVVHGFQARNLLWAKPTISTQCVPKEGSLMESLHNMRSMYNMRGLHSMRSMLCKRSFPGTHSERQSHFKCLRNNPIALTCCLSVGVPRLL